MYFFKLMLAIYKEQNPTFAPFFLFSFTNAAHYRKVSLYQSLTFVNNYKLQYFTGKKKIKEKKKSIFTLILNNSLHTFFFFFCQKVAILSIQRVWA